MHISSKVPEGHHPRGTTLREALQGNLPLRGLCRGLSGLCGGLRGLCQVLGLSREEFGPPPWWKGHPSLASSGLTKLRSCRSSSLATRVFLLPKGPFNTFFFTWECAWRPRPQGDQRVFFLQCLRCPQRRFKLQKAPTL